MKKVDLTIQQEKTLNKISGGLEKMKTKPSVYYRVENGRDLSVHMVTEEYDSEVENKIYSLQERLILQNEDTDIDFRLTPKYNLSERKMVPSGFKKLSFA